MEANDELLIKAIEQAIASVAIELDDLEYSKEILIDKQKLLILKSKNNKLIRKICYV